MLRIRLVHPDTAVMKRRAEFALQLLAMVATALICCLIAMRFAIHGSVVEVPDLSGLTVEEAAEKASKAGLNLSLENKFYSATTPSGHVLAQLPLAGAKVRHDWHVRVTESMGAQKVDIPATVGRNERDAAMDVRKASLDLGTVAHLPSPGASDIVLAQTPPPNAEGVDKPQVSLLLSSPEGASDAAYVMPSLIGLNLRDAQKRMSTAGLHVVAIAPVIAQPTISIPSIPVGQVAGQPASVAVPVPVAPPAPITGTVTSQLPLPGYRIAAGGTTRVGLNGAHIGSPASKPTEQQPALPQQTVVQTP